VDPTTIRTGLFLFVGGASLVVFWYFVTRERDLTITGRAAQAVLAGFAVIGFFAVPGFLRPTPSNPLLEYAAPGVGVALFVVSVARLIADKKGEFWNFVWLNLRPVAVVIVLLLVATVSFWLIDHTPFSGAASPTLAPSPTP
jgi:hypothetical protein